MPEIVHVACTVHDGHRWPAINTDAFNAWAFVVTPEGHDRFSVHAESAASGV